MAICQEFEFLYHGMDGAGWCPRERKGKSDPQKWIWGYNSIGRMFAHNIHVILS